MYKTILRVLPGHEPSIVNLAELQVALGLVGDAKSQCQRLVRLDLDSGQTKRVAEIYRKTR
jgi:hypothetical protein